MLRGVVLVALVAALATPSGTAAPAASGCKRVARPVPKPDGGRKPPKVQLDPKKRYEVTLATNCGSFTIRLNVRVSPRTSASFFALARSGFFDGTTFHRIVPGFVIQGGDPTGTGTGGPGYKTIDRPPRTTIYRKYLVAMAKTAAEPPGTSGSQFFVVTGAPSIQLPPDYAVLGMVYVGRKIVDRIGGLGDASEQPTQPVVIRKATVRVS